VVFHQRALARDENAALAADRKDALRDQLFGTSWLFASECSDLFDADESVSADGFNVVLAALYR